MPTITGKAMDFGIFHLFIIFIFTGCIAAYYEPNSCNETGEPLLLTTYLDNNDTEKARHLSMVDSWLLEDFMPPSHAGFITVDRTLGNHMFFWFFPSIFNDTAPLVLWLNGGPTVTSMLGLFHEHGPMNLDKESTEQEIRYHKRNHSWAGPFSMLYVDNPVNTGFSYSDSGEKGDRYTEETITQDLFHFLEQFLVIFPEYKSREIYLGGQSYAGTYIISLANHIHSQVALGDIDFDITGIYLGGPYFDPKDQLLTHAEFLYHLGIVSHKAYMEHSERVSQVTDHDFSDINLGDLFHVVFLGGAGDNFVTSDRPPYSIIRVLMNSRRIKQAVHAGSRHFREYNDQMRDKFTGDALTSRKDKLAVIMNNYKVLIYNGNLDAIISTAMIEASLLKTPWDYSDQYKNATRHHWGRKWDLAGHYSHIGKFCRVIIRGAGHQTPFDRPEASLRMMTDFVTHGCIHK